MNTEAMPAQGPVDVTVGHEEVPTFTFRGSELIGFLWHVYALARIGDAIKDMPGMQKEADPMEDQEAQNELIRGWIDELQALPCRDDGTVEFTDEPWIVNVTPNAWVMGGPLAGRPARSATSTAVLGDDFGGNMELQKLKALAEEVKQWSNCNQAWLDQSEDDPAAVVGHINEDGYTYPVATIDCDQYYAAQDSIKLARFYAAANPETVLRLIAMIESPNAK